MRSNNVAIPVTLQAVANGFGENTLVWEPANFFLGKPAADIVYSVAVSNVVISGGSSNFTYTVTVFDPATLDADSFPPTISGPSQVNVGENNAYTFTAVSNATSYQWRQTFRAPFNLTDGAENGLGNFTVSAATNEYPIIVSDIVASGTHSFHLAMPNFSDQKLTLNNLLYASANSMLTFKSRLGFASATQIARVQASTDDGVTWSDVYAQPGTGNSGENSFVARNISLSSFAGSSVRLRFNYSYNGGSVFPQTDSDVGWLIDDIVVTNIEQLVSPVITSTSTTNFNFNPAQAGNYNLNVRALIYTEFPLDWGPTKLVSASMSSTSGYSLQLDGVDDYVEVPHVVGLNLYPLTITAWLKTTNQIANSELGVVNKYVANSSNGYNLFVSQGRIRASYFNGTASVQGNGGLDGGPVANDRWHHVAFTVDASGGRIYVDGVLVESAAWVGTPGATTTTEPLRMGVYPGVVGKSNYFGGMLDEVQIWNVARSEAQVQAGVFLPLTGSEANLVAYYRFDEAPGTTGTTADLATTLAGVNSGNLSNGVARVSAAVIGMERPTVTSGQVRLNFGVPFGLPAGFELQRVGAITGTWSNDITAVLTTNTPGASFRFTTTTNGPRLFYRVRAQ